METDPTPADWDLIDAVPVVNGPGVTLCFRRHEDPDAQPQQMSFRSIVAAQQFSSTAGFPDPLNRYLAHRAATDPVAHSVPIRHPTTAG